MSKFYRRIITKEARSDIKNILKYSLENHGQKTADAYQNLIEAAFKQLQSDPYRPSSQIRHEIGDNIRSYHISLAKISAQSQIKSPRHVIFYFTVEDNALVISRILHDRQEPTRSMADIYRHVMERAEAAERKKAPQAKKDKERER